MSEAGGQEVWTEKTQEGGGRRRKILLERGDAMWEDERREERGRTNHDLDIPPLRHSLSLTVGSQQPAAVAR